MTALFVASEVGSVRAILPVAAMCRREGVQCTVLDVGAMSVEAPRWGIEPVHCQESSAGISQFLEEHGVDVLIFSSNIKDRFPLRVARQAREMGIPCIHVLDYWNGYARRLELDGGPLFLPDVYAIPDELARQHAMAEGFGPEALLVTGHPGFADIMGDHFPGKLEERENFRRKNGFDPKRLLLVFVSEPVEHDQGNNSSCAGYRGYTEKAVLKLFLDALQPCADRVQVAVLPHPREDRISLDGFVAGAKGEVTAESVVLERGRDVLSMASGVVGMSSTLLYESWLLGLPVVSIQPELAQDSLRNLENREGVLFVTKANEVARIMQKWVPSLVAFPECRIHDDAGQHVKSTETIFRLIQKFVGTISSLKGTQ